MQSANLLYKKVQNKHGKQLNFMYHLTNREALTALFSCKARRKRLKQEKSVGSVECSSRFLNRTEHNQGFSICFIIKNTLNSPSITFNFQKKLYFQSEQQCRQHALYSHKARYNKPIRIPVRMVQII